ncbi:MAG: phosphodiester glycosidase family protein [Candidatus Sumerlaeaceae bacterium]|nr:phosphodiester glycosidase family protein [Candidatus Sumerlaeaceae bacterium]
MKQANRLSVAASVRLWFAVCLLLLSPLQPAQAQQTLADADWFVRPIADGVVWRYYLFDNMFGSKQSISYLEVDLKNPNVSVETPYLAAARQRTSVMVPAQFPAAAGAINGTYFDTTGSGGHRTYLRVNNTVIPPGGALFSPWGWDSAIAKDSSGSVSIIKMPTGGWAAETTHPNIMACGPLLVDAGTIPTAYLNSIGSHCTSRHPRSAVGVTTDSRLIMVTVDGRTDMAAGMTCTELADIMLQLGCPYAMNLDGGGSTTLWGRGEQYGGVLNFPSDNSVYDHLGERACSNAVAVIAPTTTPLAWDARLTGKSFSAFMDSGTSQTVTLTYQNAGTQTWTATATKLSVARPDTRTSPLRDPATWPGTTEPAVMSPATVAPGQTASFTFRFKAPETSTTLTFDEHFKLVQLGVGRIGPADSEAWMRINVLPPYSGATTFIVESRLGGQNIAWYTDSGMADTGTNCSAPGVTPGIGSRYGSTYRSVAGAKSATVSPNFPRAGNYNVYVTWGAGSNRRNPITYKVNHTSGTSVFLIDQTATANVWVRLGSGPFPFAAGPGGTVVMSNENIDVSGSMYISAVKFEHVPDAAVDDWMLY